MVWGEDPQFSGPRDLFRNSLILFEAKRKISEGPVLDFGCGSGHLISRFSSLKYRRTGIDLSSSAISYESKSYPGVKFIRGGMRYLENTKKIQSYCQWRGNRARKKDSRLVKGFFRVLHQNGIVVISTPAHPHYWDPNDDFSSHYRRYEDEHLKLLFESYGFSEIK